MFASIYGLKTITWWHSYINKISILSPLITEYVWAVGLGSWISSDFSPHYCVLGFQLVDICCMGQSSTKLHTFGQLLYTILVTLFCCGLLSSC